MKSLNLIALLVLAAAPLAHAEDEKDAEPYAVELMAEEQAAFDAAVEDVVAEMSEQDRLRPYVILYKHHNRVNPRKVIFLDGPASVRLLSNCRKLANDISRLVIVAPSDTSLTFYDRFGRPSRPMRSGTWWGIGERRGNRVSQDELKVLGLHDSITWFEIKRDGVMPNRAIQHPSC